MTDFDLVIAGSGFAGSLLAMIARRLGCRVALVERGRHPRFAIGESTSPLANLLLEEAANRYDLPALLPLTSWGRWKRERPELVCGLKRGFTFYHHTAGQPFRDDESRARQLLVAASPCDEVADTHWLRADVDNYFVQQAVALGVEYLDQTEIREIAITSDGISLAGSREGAAMGFKSLLAVDATGPRGLFASILNLPQGPMPAMPPTHALFTHFEGVARTACIRDFQTKEEPPYPPDAAALHHVFHGGWIWALRFDNGVTSAGASVEAWLAEELRLAEGEPAWQRLLERFPSILRQFEGARPIRPFTYAPQLSYRCKQSYGDRWIMLPSAAAFVDPLFSTGFPLALLGVLRIASLLEQGLDMPDLNAQLSRIARSSTREADWTAEFISACFGTFRRFRQFTALSQLYFAAASFSEMAIRLGRADHSPGFLGVDRADLVESLRRCVHEDLRGQALQDVMAQALDPINVAGLADPAKRSWYPADLADVVRSAGKLGFGRAEMESIIQNAAWAQGC